VRKKKAKAKVLSAYGIRKGISDEIRYEQRPEGISHEK
jgi:hypothetical protein